MRRSVRLMVCAAMVAGPVSSIAKTPPPLMLSPSGKWEVDQSEWRCELRRTFTDAAGKVYLFSLPREPLNPTAYLRLVTQERSSKRGDGEGRMWLGETPHPRALAFSFFSDGGERIRQWDLDVREVRPAADVDTLRFDSRTDREIRLKVPNLAPALRALGGCVGDLYQALEIDPTLAAAIAKPSDAFAMDVVKDRPSRDGFNYVALYWVDAEGRVDSCRLLKGSGHKKFDASFCDTLKATATFTPALSASGKPMRSPVFENVTLRTMSFSAPG